MDPAQLQPGHKLDRYELLCPLAYGGMASVWLARFGGRKGFERLVVVKMILPQYSQDPRFQEMFVDEARIASRIEHANVARILDVGEQEESTFIVMEWVDGDSLSKVVRAAEAKKQRVPFGVALRICADAAAGLHAAHDLKERDGTPLGVVHRDVSPQNILISNAGTTVLIDFGVAKARDRVSQETSAGQLKGKIRYMAPEQALGRNIDPRADVWALGAILYELFSGMPPYDGPNEVATLHKLTSGQLPPPLPPHIPPPIRAVVDRALAYDPEHRYATSLELNLALEACLIEIGEPTTVAVVANYTSHLLADRKGARKRAVDTALANAHARDGERTSTPIASSPVLAQPRPPPPPPPSYHSQAPGQPQSLTPAPVSHPSRPSQASQVPYPASSAHTPPPPASTADLASLASLPSSPSQGPMGLGEVPSATSATLGSAAIEYAPEMLDEAAARRRRVMTAAILAVSVIAGVVGAVLIISTALLKHDSTKGTAAGLQTASSTAAPPEAVDPAPISGAVTAPPSTAAPSAAVATAPAAVTPASLGTPSATTTAAQVPTTTPPAPPPISPPATTPHRPITPGASTARTVKPPVTTATPATPTKPDRGF